MGKVRESWRSSSVDETRRIGGELLRRVLPHGVLLLSGEMGSGKTVLAQGVAMALGIPAAEVQSPTFNLVHEHSGAQGELIHVDLYRLEPDEIPRLGLEEILVRPAVKVIEWAERLDGVPEGVQVLVERLATGEHQVSIAERRSRRVDGEQDLEEGG